MDNKAKELEAFKTLYRTKTIGGTGSLTPDVKDRYQALRGTTIGSEKATTLAANFVQTLNPEHADALRATDPSQGGRSRRRRGRTTAKRGGSRRRRRMTSKARRH
jgi:hypothetical protein